MNRNKKQKLETKNKWYERFKDEFFLEYNTSGEATAVHIVRDIVKKIDTHGKWIDVVSMNVKNIIDFEYNWIIVELFPRITYPNYREYIPILDSDDPSIVENKKYQNKRIREVNRYITWHASYDDILDHRSQNHHGEKFIVLCDLNKKKDKSEKFEDDYKITAINRISQKQINYITEHQQSGSFVR